MTDNVTSPVTAGTKLATDEISGVHYPRTKISHGPDGSAVDASVDNPFPVDTVVRKTATDRGASVGTSASTLMLANAARRGFAIQNQSDTATVYFNGTGTAAVGYTSLKIGPGAYFETSSHHVGVGAISVISTEASTPVYAREW